MVMVMVMADGDGDGDGHLVLQGLTVELTGDEAIHRRRNSIDNVVRDSIVRDAGHRREKLGEGSYVGTAESNCCTITDCKPDNRYRNVIMGITISDTTAESIDLKAGTTGGVVADNTFDGSSLSGAGSGVDVKGKGWLIIGNVGQLSSQLGLAGRRFPDPRDPRRLGCRRCVRRQQLLRPRSGRPAGRR